MDQQFGRHVVFAVDRPDVVPGADRQRAVELGVLPGHVVVADDHRDRAGVGPLEPAHRGDGGRVVIAQRDDDLVPPVGLLDQPGQRRADRVGLVERAHDGGEGDPLGSRLDRFRPRQLLGRFRVAQRVEPPVRLQAGHREVEQVGREQDHQQPIRAQRVKPAADGRGADRHDQQPPGAPEPSGVLLQRRVAAPGAARLRVNRPQRPQVTGQIADQGEQAGNGHVGRDVVHPEPFQAGIPGQAESGHGELLQVELGQRPAERDVPVPPCQIPGQREIQLYRNGGLHNVGRHVAHMDVRDQEDLDEQPDGEHVHPVYCEKHEAEPVVPDPPGQTWGGVRRSLARHVLAGTEYLRRMRYREACERFQSGKLPYLIGLEKSHAHIRRCQSTLAAHKG